MEITRINNLVPKHIKGKAFIHTPPNLPKLHTLCISSGVRGSGKTYSVTNLIRFYKKAGLVDRVIIVSPTAISNKLFYDDLINDPSDIISDINHATIEHIHGIIGQEAEDYDAYKRVSDLFKLYKVYEKKKVPIESIPDDVILDFEKHGIFEMEELPPWKYNNGTFRKPLIHLIFDDIMSSPVMGKGLTNLAIKHRHVGDGMGISMYILVQSYVSTVSCPRPIRSNAQLLLLWGMRDTKAIDRMIEEACPLQFSHEQFKEAFEYSTRESPHSFLMVDFSAKKEHMLRKNFDTYLDFK